VDCILYKTINGKVELKQW